MMKLVTIVILYSKDSGRPFMYSGSFAVLSDEEIREAYRALVEPLIAAGETILDQLFVVMPDELITKLIEASGAK